MLGLFVKVGDDLILVDEEMDVLRGMALELISEGKDGEELQITLKLMETSERQP